MHKRSLHNSKCNSQSRAMALSTLFRKIMNSDSISQATPDKHPASDIYQEKSRAISGLTDRLLAVMNCTPLSEETAKELYSFGYALYQQDRYSDAAEIFLYLTFCSKTDGKNFMALGACYQAQADFQKASQLYRCSIDLGYSDPAVHLHLGECLLRLNKKPEAVKEFRLTAILTSDQENYLELFEKASAMVELAEKFDRP